MFRKLSFGLEGSIEVTFLTLQIDNLVIISLVLQEYVKMLSYKSPFPFFSHASQTDSSRLDPIFTVLFQTMNTGRAIREIL